MIFIRLHIDHMSVMIAKPYRAFKAFCETFRSCSRDILKTDAVFLLLRPVLNTFLHARFSLIFGKNSDAFNCYAFQEYA